MTRRVKIQKKEESGHTKTQSTIFLDISSTDMIRLMVPQEKL
jgi:hypothetical protein